MGVAVLAVTSDSTSFHHGKLQQPGWERQGVCYGSAPIFPLSSTHVTARAFSFPCHLPRAPACASKSQGLSSLTLHSRALSFLPTFSSGSSQLCRGFLSHSPDSFVYDSLIPFSAIHLPHLVRFLIPIDVTGTSRFTFIRGLMLLSLILYYT